MDKINKVIKNLKQDKTFKIIRINQEKCIIIKFALIFEMISVFIHCDKQNKQAKHMT